jgi:hypothetical protein
MAPRSELQELLDMFADGSGFGDPEARRNAEQRLQVLLAKDQQRIGNRLNWLTFLLVIVGLLNVGVLAFQVWGGNVWTIFRKVGDPWGWRPPHPPVGVFIGIVAVLGIILPLFWSRVPKYVQAAWVFVFLGLLGLEMRSIVEEREDNQTKFETTASELTKIISQATGGDSYIYFDVTEPNGPIETAIPGIDQGSIIATAYDKLVGEFPLHDVVVRPFCPMGWLPPITYYTLYQSNTTHVGILCTSHLQLALRRNPGTTPTVTYLLMRQTARTFS